MLCLQPEIQKLEFRPLHSIFPNDERVRQAKGSKKVMLKNIHEAKFEKILRPIAEMVLDSNRFTICNL
jgi:hypothetical protein